jgi:ubiquinone/menaquinone biosynthesis C-methylase UbiE
VIKPRIPETDQGIQGEVTVAQYHQFQQGMRDKGLLPWKDLLVNGITHGHALEIGPGPGYLGLEWLKRTQGTTLTGFDISPDMVSLSESNAQAYNLSERATYVLGSGDDLPFDDNHFEAVFTNGSLHEWANPQGTFDQIWRVLKPGGQVYISDLRRDLSAPIKWLMWITCQPKVIRPGLTTSIQAAYTPDELQALIAPTGLRNGQIKASPFGITLTVCK